jgi:metacaspase-1
MKKAFLVGINDYPGTSNDLMGCVNDVRNMQDLLVSMFSFRAEKVRMITDRQATTANILKGLENLVSGAQSGDLLVFHYSGHGSQVPDTSGDESDKFDEILCPYDLDWKSKVIRDDDLSRILGSLPGGVHVEALLDSCHSGTGLRVMGRHNRSYLRERYLAPPKGLMEGHGEELVRTTAIKPAKVRVLWAACRSNQYAADALLDGKYGGAFTTFLCNLVHQANGSIYRKDLIKGLRTGLKTAGFEQVPQLEAGTKPRKALFLSTGNA